MTFTMSMAFAASVLSLASAQSFVTSATRSPISPAQMTSMYPAMASSASSLPASAPSSIVSMASSTPSVCGPGLRVCLVSDPTRREAPWAGSSGTYPQCYNPSMYSCTFNFLCPVGTVKLAGLYACSDYGNYSNGTSFSNVTTNQTTLGSPANQMLQAVVNAPSVGDVDGINAQNFIVDISFKALSTDANSAIPLMPLYQDMQSSTFGPGPNAAFPGLVVLQNTTSQQLGGPSTNLAGTFQLNGVSQLANGLNQWNTVWQAGGPLFGVGPSELVVYYVEGTAGMTAPYRPTSGLLSNVVRVPFTISNRTENVASDSPTCYNGDVYQAQPDVADSSMAVDISVPYPTAGDSVGVNGRGWLMDVAGTVSSDMYNAQLSNSSGYTSGYNSPNSSTFAPGANAFLPGMVVTLNTTQDMGPFSGPMTNLAGLFQVNVARVKDCDTRSQVWSSWFVGMAIAGHGPVQATAYFVSGDAPDVVNENTPSMAISQPTTVDFILT